ncbi:Lyst-interacting-like protein [Thalictrum thalictroides]|uniref:Lyst-interacting-like protein n=1 Tax=Thalictrum thalictroides TaxID=46969 RepID=A0A7J6V0J7_THATH|nr:Lyst-interacting-like protein [Thalictrum thalictroides]
MERGLKIPQKDRTKTTNSILISLMNQLEKDKKSLKLGADDQLYVEGFASNVFARADKQDRAGRADLNTAKTFYAASIFYEILNQFGEIQPDLEQKQKYAVWKAADIRKALKEGRKPVPGPPGGDNDLSDPSNSSSTEYDLGPSEDLSASHLGTGADAPSQFNEKASFHSSAYTPTSPPSYPASIPPSYPASIPPSYPASIPPSSPSFPTSEYPRDDFQTLPSPNDRHDNSYPGTITSSSPSYPTSDYPRDDFHTHPSPSNRESSYPQPYHHQTYQPESPQPPQTYSSNEVPPPSYSLPNFQSYPGFNDHSLPAAPTHTPYYQGSDGSYPQQSAPTVSNYQSTSQYSSSSINGTHAEPAPTAAQTFHYDSNYQPPPEKIAEAHKAARFAVGALAFDDVAIAVDFLTKSLELLTNPSASH